MILVFAFAAVATGVANFTFSGSKLYDLIYMSDIDTQF